MTPVFFFFFLPEEKPQAEGSFRVKILFLEQAFKHWTPLI